MDRHEVHHRHRPTVKVQDLQNEVSEHFLAAGTTQDAETIFLNWRWSKKQFLDDKYMHYSLLVKTVDIRTYQKRKKKKKG